jgi:hypothetical protein
MIKNILTHIGGVEVYGVISVCLFFAVFSVAVVLALRMKKSVVARMSALPLEDSQPAPKEVSHE